MVAHYAGFVAVHHSTRHSFGSLFWLALLPMDPNTTKGVAHTKISYPVRPDHFVIGMYAIYIIIIDHAMSHSGRTNRTLLMRRSHQFRRFQCLIWGIFLARRLFCHYHVCTSEQTNGMAQQQPSGAYEWEYLFLMTCLVVIWRAAIFFERFVVFHPETTVGNAKYTQENEGCSQGIGRTFESSHFAARSGY